MSLRSRVVTEIWLELIKNLYGYVLIPYGQSHACSVYPDFEMSYGIVCQIMKILCTISFGSHSFDIALLLRESYLINGILTNTEVWYHLATSETGELDKVDRNFFQQLLCLPRSVPYPALYLESGVLPISVLINVRRLNYLHSILKGPENGTLQQVFQIQWNFPSTGDSVAAVNI